MTHPPYLDVEHRRADKHMKALPQQLERAQRIRQTEAEMRNIRS